MEQHCLCAASQRLAVSYHSVRFVVPWTRWCKHASVGPSLHCIGPISAPSIVGPSPTTLSANAAISRTPHPRVPPLTGRVGSPFLMWEQGLIQTRTSKEVTLLAMASPSARYVAALRQWRALASIATLAARHSPTRRDVDTSRHPRPLPSPERAGQCQHYNNRSTSSEPRN
jgi:hypothetical protein